MINRTFDPSPDGHGTHWRTICDGSEESIMNFVYALLREPHGVGTGKVVQRKREYITKGVRGWNLFLTVQAVMVKKKRFDDCAMVYPSFKKGNDIKGAVLKNIKEHKNHMEAILTIGIYGQELSFFDLDYFKNRDKYQIGYRYDFTMGAFAYNVENANNHEHLFRQDEMFPNDYAYRLPVNGIIWHLDLYGTPILRIPLNLFSKETKLEFNLPVFTKTEFIEQDPLQREWLQGKVWLCGRMVDND